MTVVMPQLDLTRSFTRLPERFEQSEGAAEKSFAAFFAEQSQRAVGSGGHLDSRAARKAEARQAAGQLVASVFVIPLLSKLRETSWGEGPFAPNIAEKRFGPLLDQQIADRIVEASNFEIVDAIAERYAGVEFSRQSSHSGGGFERTA